jgi:hypothetical protein
MRTKQFALLLAMLFSIAVYAQKMSIENVYKIQLRNSGAIKEAK